MAYQLGQITSFRGLRFTVTEGHLKLLKRANWESDDGCEFGSVGLNPKRPFGNSDVYEDMHKIMEDKNTLVDDEFSDKAIQLYNHIFFQELPVVLEIICTTGLVKAGKYERTNEFKNDWKPVK